MPLPPTRLRTLAYAKINLGLKIGPRRADGFHELRTVFQTISLADRVHVELRPGRGVSLAASGLPLADSPSHLARRAAELAMPALGIRRHAAIQLEKRIPIGAGLGGGSSDAASVLRLLALACRQRPPLALLLELGRALGSDVPAFLLGGTVLGLGRGDEVYALQDLGRWHCVLALPRAASATGLSTQAAYADWDRRHGRALTAARQSDTLVEFCGLIDQVLPAFRTLRNRGSEPLEKAAKGPKVHAGIENDFHRGVLSLSPDFSRIHQQLVRSSAAWVSLSGSGAAQYGLFAEAGRAQAAARQLARRHCSWAARFISRKVYERSLKAE